MSDPALILRRTNVSGKGRPREHEDFDVFDGSAASPAFGTRHGMVR
jgi:hypothetical protein